MPIIKQERATPKQKEYIEQLAIDLQFDRKKRNAHIESIVFKDVKNLDGLSKLEASRVIDQFKKWKEAKFIGQTSENQV